MNSWIYSALDKWAFLISRRSLRYYRTEMQRAVLPPRSGTTGCALLFIQRLIAKFNRYLLVLSKGGYKLFIPVFHYYIDQKQAVSCAPLYLFCFLRYRLPEILVKAVFSFYEEAETKVRVKLGLSEKFSVKVGVHHVSVLCFCCVQWWWLKLRKMQGKVEWKKFFK